jgi:hypothetical protein
MSYAQDVVSHLEGYAAGSALEMKEQPEGNRARTGISITEDHEVVFAHHALPGFYCSEETKESRRGFNPAGDQKRLGRTVTDRNPIQNDCADTVIFVFHDGKIKLAKRAAAEALICFGMFGSLVSADQGLAQSHMWPQRRISKPPDRLQTDRHLA